METLGDTAKDCVSRIVPTGHPDRPGWVDDLRAGLRSFMETKFLPFEANTQMKYVRLERRVAKLEMRAESIKEKVCSILDKQEELDRCTKQTSTDVAKILASVSTIKWLVPAVPVVVATCIWLLGKLLG